MDDKRIIALFHARSEDAIGQFSGQYGAKLLAMAKNIVKDPQDAEECVNDTYLVLWNTIPPQDPHPLLTYACRITRNISLNRLRLHQAQRRRSDYDVSLDELADCIGTSGLEDEMDVRLLGQCINGFLGKLSKENRKLFLLRYWFGESVQTIAANCQLSENVVSVRLNRIRNKLKLYLTQEGYYEK